jgi:hypothetical protein
MAKGSELFLFDLTLYDANSNVKMKILLSNKTCNKNE